METTEENEAHHSPENEDSNSNPTSPTSTTRSDSEIPSTSKGPAPFADEPEQNEDQRMFECNICLDTARDAVVSLCGHLFCWPCLHQWLETRPNRQSCPVCKAAISKDKVIPLYGRGGSQVDPRSKIPPRPTPTRQEAADAHRFSWGADGNAGTGSFHMSFGIGAFPFGFFASAFNWGQNGQQVNPGANFVNQAALEEQEFLSKVFLWVALVFMIWLLLA